jgi:ABC-2 type transport system ATP-binding protein
MILQTADLTRVYGQVAAVDHLTLGIEAGEVFGLLGPNGAGKTTTIKMLTTLLAPTAGTATVAGFDIQSQAADVRRAIGYVPQLLSADGTLTGYENLLVFAKLYDLPRVDRSRRVHDALAMMGLDGVSDRLVRTYSGGMIRRLEIAQAMLHHPPVLFLDEPTVGLDPVARGAVWEHIEQLRAEFGTTILLTTHYMEEADHLCRRVAIMHEGKVAACGTPAELKSGIAGLAPQDGNGGAAGERTNGDGPTLDQVFVYYTGTALESGGGYRETARARRTARRLS